MKKPWVIGLLSIVPGLGLIVLGQVSVGLGVLAVMTLLGLLSLLAPSDTIWAVCLTLGLIIWGVQLYYAVVLAQRLARAEAGLSLPERQVSIAPPPPGASAGERSLHKARVAVMQLLPPGEPLRVALHGTSGAAPIGLALLDVALAAGGGTPAGSGDVRQLYLGITESDLLLVSLDAFGKPADLQRVPLEQVSLVSFKEGLLSDEVVIDVGGSRPLKVGVGRPIRQGTRGLVAILSGRDSHPLPAEAPLPPDRTVVAGSQAPGIPASRWAVRPSKHPVLFSALLGACGGVVGVLAAALLSGVVGMSLGSALTDQPGLAEGLGMLLGMYCLVMFPFGGVILGAIPGTIVGMLRRSPAGELAPLPPILAGFLTVVVLTLGALLAMLASF